MSVKTNQKKFWAYNDIFDVLGNKLKPNGIAVYLCLIRHANKIHQCYPSFKLIAKKCGMSRMTVIRTIDHLVKLDLIQVQKRKTDKGGDTSNLYIIKKLPNNIDTENVVLESDSTSDRGLPTPASESYLRGLRELPPPVSESDPRGIRELPKGRQDEGRLYLKDDKTKDDDEVKKNYTNYNANLSSSISFKLSELNSPINLSQPDFKVLNKLPDNHARQQVLDVLADSIEKGTAERPKAFLQGLVKNYLASDFTPINKSKTFDTNKAERFNNQQLIDNCPYCDNNGIISLTLKEDSKSRTSKCGHPKTIKWNNLEFIATAKNGYQSERQEQIRINGKTHQNNCPYCNDKGQLILLDEDNNTDTIECSHGPIRLNNLGKSSCGYNYIKILSAQANYQTPGKIGLTAINQIINNMDDFDIPESEELFPNPDYDDNNQEDNWDVPF